MKKIKFKNSFIKLFCLRRFKMVLISVMLRIMMILILGVIFNFRNGLSVVVVDMKVLYRLKILIVICLNNIMISIINEKGLNNWIIWLFEFVVKLGSVVVSKVLSSII